MKNLVMVILVVGCASLSHGAGGDLGGGGAAMAFRLSEQEVEALRKQGNLDAAYMFWLNALAPQERQKVMENVFRFHIAPQIQK